ncbi:MAG TPA: protein kinase [Candidatus Nanoarchaeia archaeon]|nr:protein kinase [Candidatus Nanoarchaeia archaeon]
MTVTENFRAEIGPYTVDRKYSGKPVYFGRHRETGREVVIKESRISLIKNTDVGKLLLTYEAELLTMLDHPQICRIERMLAHNGKFYLVTPRAGTEDFGQFAEGNTQIGRHTIVLEDIARALVHCHEREIAHLDVKEDNITVDNGRGVLIDFGAARKIGESHPTIYNSLILTPSAAAPERLKGGFTTLSDTFSFALMLFRTFTGRDPFEINDDDFLDYGSPRYERRELDASRLGKLVLAGLEITPERRPTMREMADAIRELNSKWHRQPNGQTSEHGPASSQISPPQKKALLRCTTASYDSGQRPLQARLS